MQEPKNGLKALQSLVAKLEQIDAEDMQDPKLTDWISQADEMSEALREKLENRECKDIPEIESFFRSCVQQIASQRYKEGVEAALVPLRKKLEYGERAKRPVNQLFYAGVQECFDAVSSLISPLQP